jgi:hypothetical protein
MQRSVTFVVSKKQRSVAGTSARRFRLCQKAHGLALQCLPRHRNWSAREKCLPCQRGGQECGPNVRFNNGSSGTSLPRTAGLLLPRPASTDSDINPFAPSDTNPNQDSQHIEPPPTTGFTLAGSARTGAEARDGSVSHFAQTTLPRSPQLLKSGEELEQRDHASKL